jgi:hypothetical protein
MNPLHPWQQRLNPLLDTPEDPLPKYPEWADFLRSHFSYDPHTGALRQMSTGKYLVTRTRSGGVQSIRLPDFLLAPRGHIRSDQLAWLLMTSRLPDVRTTRLVRDNLLATSIEWHKDGFPRSFPETIIARNLGGFAARVRYSGQTTKIGGLFRSEELAKLAADKAAIDLHMEWASGLVSLASFLSPDKEVIFD